MTPNDELAQALEAFRRATMLANDVGDRATIALALDAAEAYIDALEAENTQLKGDLQAEIDLREMVVAFVNDWLDSVGVPREVNGYKLLPYGVLRRAYEALHAHDPARQVEPGEKGGA